MKLGIGSYTYMWSIGFPGVQPEVPMTAPRLLAKACELGARVVQYGPNLPLDSLFEGELDALIARAREAGIDIEIGTRGLDRAHLQKQLRLAVRAGAALLRTVPEFPDGSVPPPDYLAAALRAIEPELAAAGVCLALENGRIPAGELAAVLDSFGSPWLGVTLDTVNSLAIPEGTEQVIRELARHTKCVHVKDFVVRRLWHMMGFTVEGAPAGSGQLDVPRLLASLRAAGAAGNAILELWPPAQPSLKETIALEQQWAAESVSYLRTLIPQ